MSLSRLALLARERGYLESSHVVWEGLSGVQDWNLMDFVVAGGWTLDAGDERFLPFPWTGAGAW